MKSESRKTNRHLLLLKLNLKQALITLPKLTGIFILMALIFALAGLAIVKAALSSTKSEPLKVALVTNDDSWWIETLEGYLEQNVNCRFIKMNMEEGMNAISKQEVAATLILPDDVISAITESQDGACTLVFAYPGQFTSLGTFQNLAKTGMADIAAMDAAEKLIDSIQTQVLGRSNYNQVYQIENDLVLKILVRSATFNKELYSDSGDLDLKSFYIGNIILALLLFTGVFLQELLCRRRKAYLVMLERTGISSFTVGLFQFLSVAIVQTVFLCIMYFIAAGFGFIPAAALSVLHILVFALDVTGLLFLCYQLCDSKFAASMIVFLGSLVMMFFSGNLIPLSFLPGAARYLSVVLPTKYIAQLSGEVASGTPNISTDLIGFAWLCLFIGIVFIVQALAKKTRKERS